MTSRAGNIKNRAGFTLLEVLVVLTIAALLIAAVPWASFGARETVELKALAKTMVAELRRARSAAIFSNRKAVFILNVKERQFGIEGKNKVHAIPPDVKIAFTTAREDLIDEAQGAVLFLPDGSSNGGSIRLSRAGQEARVDITWLTGRVVSRD